MKRELKYTLKPEADNFKYISIEPHYSEREPWRKWVDIVVRGERNIISPRGKITKETVEEYIGLMQSTAVDKDYIPHQSVFIEAVLSGHEEAGCEAAYSVCWEVLKRNKHTREKIAEHFPEYYKSCIEEV